MHIHGLKVQFNAKLWSIHPDCVLHEFKEKKQKSVERQKKGRKNPMSRHRLKNVATSHRET